MTKTIVQKKTINNILKDNYRKALSIQFSLGGFSFCISNLETKEVQHFTAYTFDTVISTPEVYLLEIEELYNEHSVLKQEFESSQLYIKTIYLH